MLRQCGLCCGQLRAVEFDCFLKFALIFLKFFNIAVFILDDQELSFIFVELGDKQRVAALFIHLFSKQLLAHIGLRKQSFQSVNVFLNQTQCSLFANQTVFGVLLFN